MITQALILCGRRQGDESAAAVRRSLTEAQGRSLLEWRIADLARQGCRNFLIIADSEIVPIEACARATAAKFDLRVEVLAVRVGIGVREALSLVGDLLHEAFCLVDGTSLFDIPLIDLAAALESDAAALAVFAGQPEPNDRAAPVDDLHVGDQLGRSIFEFVGRRAGAARRAIRNVLPTSDSDPLGAPGRPAWLRLIDREAAFVDFADADAGATIATMVTRAAIFFDRDGVLNENHGYVGSVDRLEWVEGAKAALGDANRSGFFVFVVTNQSGIARGFYSEAEYHALREHMRAELAGASAYIVDERFCPFHPEATIPAYRRESNWRKPAPGMVIDLLTTWPIARDGSFLIGDSESDIEAARRAGVDGRLFPGGNLQKFMNDEGVLKSPPDVNRRSAR